MGRRHGRCQHPRRHASTPGDLAVGVGEPHRRPPGSGHAPATQFDQHSPAGCHPVTVAEPDPLAVVGGQLQIGAEGRDPDRQHHHATRLGPGLQPAHRSTGQAPDTPADQDHIEPVDHRRQHVDPRRVAGDHHQTFQRHSHVGCGANAQLRKAGDTDPGPVARWRGSQRQRQRHRCPAAAGDGRAALQGRQQLDEATRAPAVCVRWLQPV